MVKHQSNTVLNKILQLLGLLELPLDTFKNNLQGGAT